jgi:beta-glucosidase
VEAIEFPKGFLWGTATASYQIEGAVSEDGRGESIWDRFSHTPGKILNGDTGDVADDHYHRYLEDVRLMRSLGLQTYRFSIAWPRIMPAGGGAVNQKGVDFYSRLIDALLAANIKPVPTLYHWDLPQVLEDRGGWPSVDTARYFADYATACFEAFGDRVNTWITLNEPWCSAHLGYVSGDHAPGLKDQKLGFKAAHTLLYAHGLAVQRFRDILPGKRIGITLNLSPSYPATDSEEDRAAAERGAAYSNGWFVEPLYRGDYPEVMREAFGADLPEFTPEQRAAVTSPTDFLGVNYYMRGIFRNDPNAGPLRAAWVDPGDVPRTAMGWEIYPQGLKDLLVWLKENCRNPVIYITENGAAFEDVPEPDGTVHDADRTRFLREHFLAAREAIEEGVRLEGYYVWSLLDNFEWAYGYSRRFGIVRVDYDTQKRTPKDSARWFAEVIRNNAVA